MLEECLKYTNKMTVIVSHHGRFRDNPNGGKDGCYIATRTSQLLLMWNLIVNIDNVFQQHNINLAQTDP